MTTNTKKMWEMTRMEVSLLLDTPDESITRSVLASHEKSVKQALALS